jgi:hypothetical protein
MEEWKYGSMEVWKYGIEFLNFNLNITVYKNCPEF